MSLSFLRYFTIILNDFFFVDLYTIEFQKRGLPHCHTLLWVAASHKIQEPSDIDAFVTAELPDPSSEPLLYHTVTTCMIHGPCGLVNVNATCMKDDKCKKKFQNHSNTVQPLTKKVMHIIREIVWHTIHYRTGSR